MHSRVIAIALSLGVLLSGCGSSGDEGAQTPDFNVIVISVDSLRADHLGAYGYNRATSPVLDALAAESVVFERAYAPSSFTLQSVAAILTGRLPTSGGSVSLEAQPSETAMTLGRMFRAASVRTGLISNQPLLSPRGFTRGFEDIQISGLESNWTAGDVTFRSLRFIDDNAPERFFLYAHFLDPHQPYDAPAEFSERFGAADPEATVAGLTAAIAEGNAPGRNDPRIDSLIAKYDAEIAAVDQAIGELLAGLEERGLSDSTIVVVTGSQGEEFLEHGYLGHAWTLHEEALRVPLIFHAPGLLEPERASGIVSTVDIYPALVDLFGFDVAGWQPDGSSFLSVEGSQVSIRSAQTAKLAELVIRERCIIRTVIQGDWKYVAEYIPCAVEDRDTIAAGYLDTVRAIADGSIEAPSLWGEIQRESLYNLALDPAERDDLAGSEPEQLARLKRTLEAYQAYCEVNALKATEAVAPEVTDPEAAARLRSLGYL